MSNLAVPAALAEAEKRVSISTTGHSTSKLYGGDLQGTCDYFADLLGVRIDMTQGTESAAAEAPIPVPIPVLAAAVAVVDPLPKNDDPPSPARASSPLPPSSPPPAPSPRPSTPPPRAEYDPDREFPITDGLGPSSPREREMDVDSDDDCFVVEGSFRAARSDVVEGFGHEFLHYGSGRIPSELDPSKEPAHDGEVEDGPVPALRGDREMQGGVEVPFGWNAKVGLAGVPPLGWGPGEPLAVAADMRQAAARFREAEDAKALAERMEESDHESMPGLEEDDTPPIERDAALNPSWILDPQNTQADAAFDALVEDSMNQPAAEEERRRNFPMPPPPPAFVVAIPRRTPLPGRFSRGESSTFLANQVPRSSRAMQRLVWALEDGELDRIEDLFAHWKLVGYCRELPEFLAEGQAILERMRTLVVED